MTTTPTSEKGSTLLECLTALALLLLAIGGTLEQLRTSLRLTRAARVHLRTFESAEEFFRTERVLLQHGRASPHCELQMKSPSFTFYECSVEDERLKEESEKITFITWSAS